jgi:hypothetical protein
VLPHESVDDCPAIIDAGLGEIVAVGTGGADTVTVVVVVAEPPAPVHTREYIVVVAGETLSDPLGTPAVSKPLPIQLVASVLFQTSVEVAPAMMEAGFAESDAVGATGGANNAATSLAVSAVLYIRTSSRFTSGALYTVCPSTTEELPVTFGFATVMVPIGFPLMYIVSELPSFTPVT